MKKSAAELLAAAQLRLRAAASSLRYNRAHQRHLAYAGSLVLLVGSFLVPKPQSEYWNMHEVYQFMVGVTMRQVGLMLTVWALRSDGEAAGWLCWWAQPRWLARTWAACFKTVMWSALAFCVIGGLVLLPLNDSYAAYLALYFFFVPYVCLMLGLLAIGLYWGKSVKAQRRLSAKPAPEVG